MTTVDCSSFVQTTAPSHSASLSGSSADSAGDVISPFDALRHLSASRLRIECRANDALRLPGYSGSALRGVFGHSLRELACSTGQPTCSGCPVVHSCSYPRFFEPRLLQPYGDRYEPALPLILRPGLIPCDLIAPGGAFDFEAVLLGSRGADFPMLLRCLHRMGERGFGAAGAVRRASFHIERVLECRDDGELRDLTGAEADAVARLPSPRPCLAVDALRSPSAGARLRVRFLTPTHLLAERSAQLVPDFGSLVARLLDRIERVSLTVFGRPLDLPFRAVVEHARTVRLVRFEGGLCRWQRTSTRQQRRMPMGGFVGDAIYDGPWAQHLAWLRAGEWLHVGKGSAFGMGWYRLEDLDDGVGANPTKA